MKRSTMLLLALAAGGLYLASRNQAQAATATGLPAGAMNPQGFQVNPALWAAPAGALLNQIANEIPYGGGGVDYGTAYPTGAMSPQGFPSY